MARRALSSNEIHLHLLAIGDEASTDESSVDERLLSPEEVARRNRFVFPKDRALFQRSHVFLRRVLSQYADVAPEEWRFEANSYGRPRIGGGNAPFGPLEFSLSHTAGMIAVAVSAFAEIGIDVERSDRADVGPEIASRYFAPAEIDELEGMSPERKRERFFELWTLKEAYVKARGMGLTLPLDRFRFRQDAAGEVAIEFDERFGDEPGGWRFFSLRRGNHRVAVAARSPAAERPALTVLEDLPSNERSGD